MQHYEGPLYGVQLKKLQLFLHPTHFQWKLPLEKGKTKKQQKQQQKTKKQQQKKQTHFHKKTSELVIHT